MALAHTHYAEWTTAVGTVAAAVVALGIALWTQWSQWRHAKNRAPTLRLERDAGSWLTTNSGWQKLRLMVSNDPGRDAAHDVLVSVEFVKEGQGTHHYPLNLTLPWAGLFGPVGLEPMTVPAGGRRHVELGQFVDVFRKPGFNPAPAFQVACRSGFALAPLDYTSVLKVSLTAANCDATSWTVHVGFKQGSAPEPQKPTDVTMTVERDDPPSGHRSTLGA